MQGRDKKDKKQKAQFKDKMSGSAIVGSLRKKLDREQIKYERDKAREEAKGVKGMFDFDLESKKEERKEKIGLKGDSSEEYSSSEDSSSEDEEDFDDYYNPGDHHDLSVFVTVESRLSYLQKLSMAQLFDMRLHAQKNGDRQTQLFIDEFVNKIDREILRKGVREAVKLGQQEETLKNYGNIKNQALSEKIEAIWVEAIKDRLMQLYDFNALKKIIKEGTHAAHQDTLKEVLAEKERRMYEGETCESFRIKVEEVDYYPDMGKEKQKKKGKEKGAPVKMQRGISSRALDEKSKQMYEIEASGRDLSKAENVDYYPGMKEKENEQEQEQKKPHVKRLDLPKKMEAILEKRGSKTFRLEDIKRLGGNSKTVGSFLIQSTRNANTSRKLTDPEKWRKGQSFCVQSENDEQKTELSPRVKGEAIKKRFNELFTNVPKLALTTSAVSTRKGDQSPTKLKGNTSARKFFFEEEAAKQSPRKDATPRTHISRTDDGAVTHEKASCMNKPGSKG